MNAVTSFYRTFILQWSTSNFVSVLVWLQTIWMCFLKTTCAAGKFVLTKTFQNKADGKKHLQDSNNQVKKFKTETTKQRSYSSNAWKLKITQQKLQSKKTFQFVQRRTKRVTFPLFKQKKKKQAETRMKGNVREWKVVTCCGCRNLSVKGNWPLLKKRWI